MVDNLRRHFVIGGVGTAVTIIGGKVGRPAGAGRVGLVTHLCQENIALRHGGRLVGTGSVGDSAHDCGLANRQGAAVKRTFGGCRGGKVSCIANLRTGSCRGQGYLKRRRKMTMRDTKDWWGDGTLGLTARRQQAGDDDDEDAQARERLPHRRKTALAQGGRSRGQ